MFARASCSSVGTQVKSLMPCSLVWECMRARIFAEENRKWMTLAAVSFGLFMIMLDNTVVNVALPSIQRDLGADLSELEWIVTGYALTFASLMLVGGKVADAYGRRLVFVVGIVVFTAGLAALWPRGFVGDAHRSSSPAGSGCGSHEPGDALDHRCDIPATPARNRDRHLGGNRRPGARDRPPRRRSHHRAPRMELDLLRQHSDRRPRDRCELPVHRRVARRNACEPRHSRPGDVCHRALRADVRPHRGQHVRLDLHAHRRHVRARGEWRWPPSW